MKHEGVGPTPSASGAAGSRERRRGRRTRAATCLLITLFGTAAALAVLTIPRLIGTLDTPFLGTEGQTSAPPAQGLGSTWTPTPTHTPRPPTPTQSPTATLTESERLAGLEDDIARAERLCLQCDYEQAIWSWDEILERAPEYAPGYYYRSRAYLGLTENETIFEIAAENASHALEDIDTAIALGGDQVTGDYYLARHDVYSYFAVLEEMWADREPLQRLALENLRMALALRNSHPLTPRTLPLELSVIGDCDAALAEARRLYSLAEASDPPSAGLNTILAKSHLCRGDYSQALTYLDAAIRILESPERRYDRAVALYGLGRLQEALDQLNALIDARPAFAGYRYYFRALVYYDLGMPDRAREDLLTGSYNTWGRAGVATLVAALLARDEGDQEGAIELLRLTEATIGRDLTPMLARTRAELAALGEEPLLDLPEASTLATPMPAPTPPERALPATPPATSVDYKTGAGQFSLGGEDHRAFRFISDTPAFVTEVRWLTITLDARFSPSSENIDVYLWNPRENFWTMFPWDAHEIQVPNPGRFASPLGDLFVAVTSGSGSFVTIDSLVARMEIVLPDGTVATLGPLTE